jgi:hypothetical protein
MERPYNINEIITQVGEIGALISRLNTDGNIEAIEIDIVLEKIRKLYTEVSAMKESKPPVAKPQQKSTEEPPEIKREEPKVAKPPKTTGEVKESSDPPEPATLADRFKGEKKFINEKLANNGNRQDLSSKLQSKPIQDIGSSLGLNDRFKLINELFNGDKDSYQQTINVLDGANNFNEAFNYISTSYDWDMEDDSVQMLLDLVRRKFIVNKNE